jgi:hypothetical protein
MQEKETVQIDVKTSDQIVEIGTIKSRHSKLIEFPILTDLQLKTVVQNTDNLGRLILDSAGRGLTKAQVAKYFNKSSGYLRTKYWNDRTFKFAFYSISREFNLSGSYSRVAIKELALADSYRVYSRILDMATSEDIPPHVALSASNSILDLANPKDNQGIAISIGSLLVELSNRSDIVAIKPDERLSDRGLK